MSVSIVSDSKLKTFQEQGFVLGDRLLSDAEAEHMYDLINDIVNNEENPYHQRVYNFGHGGRPLLHIKNMWKRYDVFKNLHQHPAIYAALRELTGQETFHLWQDRFFYKPAGEGGFHSWHQDSKFLPFLEPYSAVSFWIALNDADEGNGAMTMAPGSHTWGDASEFLEQVEGYAADGRALPDEWHGNQIDPVVCPVPRGYAHLHSGRTWHCSGPNWSDRPRSAIGLFFVGGDVKFDGTSRWAKDYDGEHGKPLDAEFYPLVDASTVAAVEAQNS